MWLRTDLVRLDFSLSSGGVWQGQAWGQPEGAASPGVGGGGRQGQVWLLQSLETWSLAAGLPPTPLASGGQLCGGPVSPAP